MLKGKVCIGITSSLGLDRQIQASPPDLAIRREQLGYD